MKRIAIYAGSFDPVTFGHLSVIERGRKLFDHLIVVVAINPAKNPLFNVQERMSLLREATSSWRNVSVSSTAGYVVHFARERGASFLLRGVRDACDSEAEVALARLNYELDPSIETVFVAAHPTLSRVSSSQLKLAAMSDIELETLCPPHVARALRQRMERSSEDANPHHGGR